jgi:hypothetical protein
LIAGGLKGMVETGKIPKTSGQINQERYLEGIYHQKLQNLIKSDYRSKSMLGDGGTADAIRLEIETNKSVGNKFHSIKGKDLINGYNNALNSGELNMHETNVATRLRDNLLNASKK